MSMQLTENRLYPNAVVAEDDRLSKEVRWSPKTGQVVKIEFCS
jgi:hypothetical protein